MEATVDALIEQAMQKLLDQGYKPVEVMFDITENIYWGLGFKKGDADLNDLHPYKGNRELEKFGVWIVTYALDEDLSAMNAAGSLIYIEPDPDDYDEDDEIPEVNQDETWYPGDTGNFKEQWEGSHSEEILHRLNAILAGTKEHWSEIRTDH